MEITDINDIWWSALSIQSKERVSKKEYPSCSAWWNELDSVQKQAIHDYLSDGYRHEGKLEKWTFCY